MNANECTLFHGGLKGAETVFGENAEKFGVNEVIFTFEGHRLNRDNRHALGRRTEKGRHQHGNCLTHDEPHLL